METHNQISLGVSTRKIFRLSYYSPHPNRKTVRSNTCVGLKRSNLVWGCPRNVLPTPPFGVMPCYANHSVCRFLQMSLPPNTLGGGRRRRIPTPPKTTCFLSCLPLKVLKNFTYHISQSETTTPNMDPLPPLSPSHPPPPQHTYNSFVPCLRRFHSVGVSSTKSHKLVRITLGLIIMFHPIHTGRWLD